MNLEFHDYGEVIDHLVAHGRYNADLPLLRAVNDTIELAVPRDIRPHWTVNRFELWRDQGDEPVARREDGMQVWLSDSLHMPFCVAVESFEMTDDATPVMCATLEDAMRTADRLTYP